MNKRGRPPKHSPPLQSDLPEMLSLWRTAADSAKGIKITSAFPNRLLQKLYAARREVGGFDQLKLIETETEVWIVPR